LRRLIWILTLVGLPSLGLTQQFSALARIEPGSLVQERAGGLEVVLQLSQSVPYRVYYLADPYRVVMEFSEVEWSPVTPGSLNQSDQVAELRSGPVRPGWSRLVLQVTQPMLLGNAQMQQRGDLGAEAQFVFETVDDETFAAKAGLPADLMVAARQPVQTALRQPREPGAPLYVMLDPGHGGIDPGATVGDVHEANLMLTFARELQDLLNRSDQFKAVLTRQSDDFVSLEARVTAAREAGADVFVSLHADVVLEGQARGVAIYTLAEEASDIASEKLAERHDRDDLLSGVDLSEQDDTVALILMDIARNETAYRTRQLAQTLVEVLEGQVDLYKRPHLEAGFSVLKSPEIPSVLIELGFMSSKHDLDKLQDAEWRARAAAALREGLAKWADLDAANAALRRQ